MTSRQGARARIDTAALAHNFEKVRAQVGAAAIMAVIKADAYGHGMLRIARALGASEALAVAHVEEALTLRGAGVEQPMVVLEGVSDSAQLDEAARAGLELVVHCDEQLQMLEGWRGTHRFAVWLKIDSGMNRLGFRTDEAAPALGRLRAAEAVAAPVRFMTHLASADEPDNPATGLQVEVFRQALADERGAVRSIANSAALLSLKETHVEWVRPGIVLYGVSPFADRTGAEFGLRPVMTLSTRLIATKWVRRGERVGYGGTWQADRDTRIGIAGIGYGDGYPRHAANGTPVLVAGRRAALVGRVSMDMIAVDLSNAAHAQVGDSVVLWGEGLPVEEVARHADASAYELLTGITRRVERFC